MDKILKSCLFTPATKPERFSKACEVHASLLLIDLEDAVAPDDKPQARATALAYLAQNHESNTKIGLRINDVNTLEGLQDLVALLQHAFYLDYLVIPKLASVETCTQLDKLLTHANHETKLIGLIETAAGLAALPALTNATPRLAGLMLGAADLSADLGCQLDAMVIDQARNQIVQTCATSNRLAIDSPYFDIKNDEGLRQETQRIHDFGFHGKAAIHPKQIPFINAVFTPTAEEVAYAKQVLIENEKGVGVINGKMIDEAIAKKARKIILSLDEEITP